MHLFHGYFRVKSEGTRFDHETLYSSRFPRDEFANVRARYAHTTRQGDSNWNMPVARTWRVSDALRH